MATQPEIDLVPRGPMRRYGALGGPQGRTPPAASLGNTFRTDDPDAGEKAAALDQLNQFLADWQKNNGDTPPPSDMLKPFLAKMGHPAANADGKITITANGSVEWRQGNGLYQASLKPGRTMDDDGRLTTGYSVRSIDVAFVTPGEAKLTPEDLARRREVATVREDTTPAVRRAAAFKAPGLG